MYHTCPIRASDATCGRCIALLPSCVYPCETAVPSRRHTATSPRTSSAEQYRPVTAACAGSVGPPDRALSGPTPRGFSAIGQFFFPLQCSVHTTHHLIHHSPHLPSGSATPALLPALSQHSVLTASRMEPLRTEASLQSLALTGLWASKALFSLMRLCFRSRGFEHPRLCFRPRGFISLLTRPWACASWRSPLRRASPLPGSPLAAPPR